MKNPKQLLNTLSLWSKFPVDPRTLLADFPDGLDRLIDLEAPLDLAIVLDPRGGLTPRAPFMAVSIGLTSQDKALAFARSKGQAVERVRPGIYSLGSSPGKCVIAAALGRAPARLVCGDEPDDLAALLAYMTRGLPNESFGKADLHFELRGEPVRRRHGRELRQLKSFVPMALGSLALDVPRYDRALGEALHAVVDEGLALVDDFDRLDFDFTLEPASEFGEVKLVVRFQKASSWITQTLADSKLGPALAPDSFWRLPSQATDATFAFPPNVKRFERIRSTLGELIDGLLEHEKVSRAVRDKFSDVVDETWTTDAPIVYAHGSLAPSPDSGKLTGPDLERERLRLSVGFYLAGAESKADAYTAYFSKLAKLYADPQVRQLIQKRLHQDVKTLPVVRQRAPRGPGPTPGAMAFEVIVPGSFFEKVEVHDGPELATGGQGMKTVRRPKLKGKPLSIVAVIMPDGPRTWFGLSADEKLLTTELAKLKAAPGASALGSREGLTDLKNARVLSGGYTTLAGWVGSAGSLIEAALGSGRPEVNRMLNALAHHGETPMPYTFGVTRERGPLLTWTWRVPKAAFEDLGGLVPAFAGSMGKSLGSSSPDAPKP